MTRTALQLAALASAAVPGLDPVAADPPDVDGMDYEVAIVTDAQRRKWVVRAPRRPAAAAKLDTERRLLPLLGRQLPVAVPQPVGRAALPEGGHALVYPHLPGRPLDPVTLGTDTRSATRVGQVLGAVHEVDPRTVEDAGLASYSAEEYRLRRLSDVDRAASTGHVPAELLARWERALEQVTQWRFVPTLIHGDLAGEHVLMAAGDVSALIDWGDACVADPADDLAWVALGAGGVGTDTVLEAYVMARAAEPDRHLLDRARLAGELALARWLLGGVAADDAVVIDRASEQLRLLAQRVAGAAR